MESPTTSELRELFDLDGESGVLRWRKRVAFRIRIGDIAGSFHEATGYRVVQIGPKKYRAHRIVMAMVTGEWPSGEVDHINGNRADNRPANLRPSTRAQNMMNKSRYRSNKSGIKGVCWSRSHGKWHAQISIDRKVIGLGFFDEINEAADAYRLAAERHFGEFARVA